jgi:hemin uptake protein HemP
MTRVKFWLNCVACKGRLTVNDARDPRASARHRRWRRRNGKKHRRNTETRRIAIAGHQIDSRELFVDTREVTILHGVDVYRLRLTAQNKLILTK